MEIITEFEFLSKGKGHNKYPWAEWLDGSIRVAKQGEDFDVPTSSFRAGVISAAKRAGVKVRTNQTSDKELVFQSYTP